MQTEELRPAPTGRRHSPETIEKIRASRLGRSHTEETKAAISRARLARLAAMTPEERRATYASYGMAGKRLSARCREALRASHLGRPLSEETRARIGAATRQRWGRVSKEDRAGIFAGRAPRRPMTDAERAACSQRAKAQWAALPPEECARRAEAGRLRLVHALERELAGRANTGIEKVVRARLDAAGVEYVPQKRIGPYFVDFYVPSRRCVIEVNGCYWHACPTCGFTPTARTEHDARKHRWLARSRLQVIVIWEHEIHPERRR